MATVTKKELIERISDHEGCKRALVKRVVQHFLDTITAELMQGNRIEFRDFGVFECRIRASREAQNPKTMKRVRVPPKRTVRFKAGRVMKSKLRAAPPQVDAATGLAIEATPQAVRRSARRDGVVRRG